LFPSAPAVVPREASSKEKAAPARFAAPHTFTLSVLAMNPNLMRTLSQNSSRNWLGAISVIAGILVWQLVTRYSGIPNFILPSPLSVWARFLKASNDGSLLYHTGITLIEILLGLLSGTIFATFVGYVLAKSRSLERVLSPYLVASQAIPIVAIAPLLVIWLGDGILSKVVICALIVFFPVLVNTIVGVRAVPVALYDLMNSLHASGAQILWKVEVPASLPVFLGGLRVGATLSVIGAIVGELVDAEEGLGFLLQLGDFQYDTPMVFVAVFMLIALALMLYGIVLYLEKRFLKWQEKG
jgi:ABC-type nitrate/sulfonate/bicarbonate transport system permease component